MKRRFVHSAFGVLCLCLMIATGALWLKLHHNQQTNGAIKQTIKRINSKTIIQASDSDLMEVTLLEASALAVSGRIDQAEVLLDELIRQNVRPDIAMTATYNLANAYLRQGMDSNKPTSVTGPMLELAKQRFRDILQSNPEDWDARYNLERALRLAPERPDRALFDKGKPVKSVRVVVPDFKTKDLP